MARTATRKALLDPRLVIGVLLVAASVAGVVAIVAANDRSIDVYAATRPFAPGDRLTAQQLEVRSVRLDVAADLYLAPGDVPAEGVLVSRSVSIGELVPVSALGGVDGARLAALVLEVKGALAASVGAGSVVEVWAAAQSEAGEFGEPMVIVSGATVVRLVQTSTIVSGGEVTAIEVLVPRSKIGVVLQAVADEASMSIVPSSIPLGN